MSRPQVMGIVNVTPDSFSDGGRLASVEAAVAHGLALVEQGAAILDIGGESTRPGADPVPEAEEIARAAPVAARLRAAGVALLTLGQYLAPSAAHHPVARFVPPAEFDRWRDETLALGFACVAAAPHVRSSYHAEELLACGGAS